MIPVHVVTGFLGSGKTTLLREVLARPDFADTAVIVNEFGEVGLDHVLLEEVEEGVLLLESGCICCTIRSDLQETIRDLQARAAKGAIPRFNRLIVETTGLADPAPIVSTVVAEPVIRNHFRIGNIICTVDGIAGAATLEAQPEAKKQVSIADRILITKTDLIQPAAAIALASRLSALNALADIGRSDGRDFDADLLFGVELGDPGRREAEVARWLAGAAAHGDHDHSADAHSFVLSYDRPIDWIAFGIWLTALLHAHGERILRVKGLLELRESETPVVIHGVQHVVHPPLHLARWPTEERGSKIVFITRGVEETAVRQSLDRFLELAAVADAPADAA